MTHVNQHGGWSTAARRRGEQYAMCNTCGMARHPRLVLRQASHVPPATPWHRYAVAVAAIVAVLAIVAQAGPFR